MSMVQVAAPIEVVRSRHMSGAPEASASLWTGRSALSAVTESSASRFDTSGARCTRVSAMRPAASRAAGRAHRRAALRTGTTAQRRRASREPIPLG